MLTGRYDVRAWYTFLTQLLRATGLIVGAQYGVTEAVLGLVLGQIFGSVAVGWAAITVFNKFPAAEPEPLGEDRKEIVRFVIQSSIGSGIVSLRTAILPLLLGKVSATTQVGYFRAAQAPLTGLSALTSPARLILITEQTKDWEAGAFGRVFAGLRRYSFTAFGAMIVSVPFLYWAMPWLITTVFTDAYAPASDAARLMLIAGAISLVFAWTKSLPVSVGQPRPADRHPRDRDGRGCAADTRARLLLGRNRRRRRRADLDHRLRGRRGRSRSPACTASTRISRRPVA